MSEENVEKITADFFGLLRELKANVRPYKKLLKSNPQYFDDFFILLSNKKEKITDDDIYNYLNKYNYNIRKDQIKYFILLYSKGYEQSLDKDNLKNWFGFNEEEEDEEKNNEKLIEKQFNDVKFYFLKALEIEMEYIEVAIKMLTILKKKDFDIHEIFHVITKGKSITVDDLLEFLKNNGIKITKEDIFPIIYIFDKNNKGQIDFEDFHFIFGYPNCEIFCPLDFCSSCGSKGCKNCIEGVLCPKDKIYHEAEEIQNYSQELNEYLKKVMEKESEIEEAKKNAALYKDFNCEDCFRLFEQYGANSINQNDIKQGLKNLGIFPLKTDIDLFMKKYDLLNGGKLDFEDFCDMITPLEKNFRDDVFERKPNDLYSSVSNLSDSTKESLRQLFEIIIDIEKDLNNKKLELPLKYINLKEIFDCFNKGKNISHDDFMKYLEDNGIYLGLKEAELLFVRLDRKKDGEISLDELEEELTPLI